MFPNDVVQAGAYISAVDTESQEVERSQTSRVSLVEYDAYRRQRLDS